MKKPVYKRNCNKSSLVFEETEENGGIFFQLQMILENRIKGFLPCEIHPYNGEKHIYYDITGRQTLSCIFEKKQMKAEDVKQLLLGVKDVLEYMQEYLLDADNLLLLPEFIYLDLSKGCYFFCFYPFEAGSLKEQLVGLAEYLLEKIDHEDQEAVVVAYQFYRQIRESNSSFLQIVEQLYEERERGQEEITEYPSGAEEPYEEEWDADGRDPALEKTGKEQADKKEWGLFYAAMGFLLGGIGYGGYDYCMLTDQRQKNLLVYCRTTVFQIALCMILTGILLWVFSFYFYRTRKKQRDGILLTEKESDRIYELSLQTQEPDWQEAEEEELPVKEERTVLLSECRYREERRLAGTDHKKQMIELTDFPFTIGKLEGMVDYVLSDRSVSRMHVRFTYREEDDTVYIQDLNSTNGTYHNGIRLEGDEMLPVYAGDEIRIGKKVFIYQ